MDSSKTDFPCDLQLLHKIDLSPLPFHQNHCYNAECLSKY